MRADTMFVLAVALLAPAAASGLAKSSATVAANPIRRVVSMLQNMQKKVEAEGKSETELYDKFMCYCKTSGGELKASVAGAEAKVPTIASELQETKEKQVQEKENLKTNLADRDAAKEAIKSATALRSKEASEFGKVKAESDSNIGMLSGAIAALEKGTAAFLQSGTARSLKAMILSKEDLAEYDRDEIVSFLSGGEFAPGTGEIIGILKTMKEEMAKGLAAATAAEDASIKSTEALVAAKKKEIAALSEQIETGTVLIGELGVKAVQMAADLSDTEEQVIEDKKFLADMDKNCATKTGEYEANMKLRSEELVALADTIKLLNDDDALELFKKTLPGASSSLIQLKVTEDSQRRAALAKLNTVHPHGGRGRLGINFIALALMGKKAGFEKITAMIDKMIAEIKTEQMDDDHKKEYCEVQIEQTETKVKTLKVSIDHTETANAAAEEDLGAATSDIATLEGQIKDLDKAMAEATAQRKEESDAYSELMASDAAAKELLEFAKNRLLKFYKPNLYEAPASFMQVSAHARGDAAPPPPPETADAYSKKSSDANGVIAMIELLMKDLSKEMFDAKNDEKSAQKEYEETVEDSKEQRQMYSKQLVEKDSTKASLETSLQAGQAEATSMGKELMATEKYLAGVNSECSWLLQYFDVRAEARSGEIESLKQAKAVLSGADYSLVQVGLSRQNLRGVQ